ncbi:hypothetical protein QYE76_071921 [Lolium multiflorum]|uniref:Transposase n=1 Tax=Lolium multiflorum TaxID=4521 RepID=A0AAD8QHX0_LOLMU|nr:hypothetical protein QYE76_071921 [Lolium multiflorum]
MRRDRLSLLKLSYLKIYGFGIHSLAWPVPTMTSMCCRIMQGEAPRVSYEINENEYDKPYYIANGIKADWATLMKTVRNPNSEKPRRFAKMQEACRKDVERGFGVLQAWWAIVRHPAKT